MTIDLSLVLARVLPQAIAWVKASAALGFAAGRPLAAAGVELAGFVGVGRAEDVRVCVVGEMPGLPTGELATIATQLDFLGPGTQGLALDSTIFVREGCFSYRLLAHELRHVHQFEAAGSIDAYIPQYLAQIARFGYRDAPFEVDAREYESRSEARLLLG